MLTYGVWTSSSGLCELGILLEGILVVLMEIFPVPLDLKISGKPAHFHILFALN